MARAHRNESPDARAMIDDQAEVVRLVERAASADDRAETLSHLLDAWRREPAGEIRELVVLASRLCLPDAAPASPAMETKEWNALEKKRDPVTLPRLAEAAAAENPTEALRRLTALSRWPADPRLVDAILAWVARAPIQTAAADAKRFWAVAFRILEKSGDRTLPRTLASVDPDGSGTTVIFLRSQAAKLLSSLIGVRVPSWSLTRKPPALPPEPALGESLLAAIADAKGRLGSAASASGTKKQSAAQTEASLLAAIHADPAADEPRLVYADWLQQRGDPWGELIVLQIADAKGQGSAASRKRIDALIAKHAAARHEGLPVVWKPVARGMIQPARCARGFAVSGEIWVPFVRKGPAHGDPRWGTFETLRFVAVDPKEIVAYVKDPAVAALRSVTNLVPATAPLIAASRRDRLEEIGVEVERDPAGAAAQLAPLAKHPWLRSLVVECPIGLQRALIETVLAGPLSAIPRLEIGSRTWGQKDPWRLHVLRDGGRLRVEVALRTRLAPAAAAPLAQAVAAAAAGPCELVLRSAVPVAAKSVPPLLAQVFGARAAEAKWLPPPA